jgi:F-type H+-transporting ATPase subunit delta
VKARDVAAARRYALAALEIALKAGTADALRDDLRGARALLSRSAELAEILSHPAVPAEQRRAVLERLLRKRASELGGRLLGLLAERGRIGLLPAVADAYDELLNAERGVVVADVVSATPLDQSQLRALAGALRQVSGRDTELRPRVVPEVLGGLKVELDGKVYDGTVRARLAALRERLSAVHGS